MTVTMLVSHGRELVDVLQSTEIRSIVGGLIAAGITYGTAQLESTWVRDQRL